MKAYDPTFSVNDRFRVSGGKIGIGYPNRPGRISATPSYVVTIIDGGNLPAQHVIGTVTKILADRTHDLVVRVEMRAGADDRTARLRDVFGRVPRVRIAPPCSALDEFPDAPFHVVLPASIEFAQHLVHRLRTRLGDAVTAVSFLSDGTQVLITRAWAFRRMCRSEAGLAYCGKMRRIPASTLKLRSVDPTGAAIRITSAQAAGWPGTWPQLLDWALDIRSFGEARAFLKWSVGLVRWGVANKRRRAILYLRRAALRDHALRVCRPPLVSILVATRRPRFLSWILDAVARQTYPNLELVLALHGGAFADIERRIAELRIPVKTVPMPACEPLGAVLNAATAAASGIFLAKMDDDDLYGSDHIWEMVLAHEYSKAPLVGKWSEFVYLAASDQTIHRSRGPNEDYQGNLTGGALLISRRALDRVGGWRRTQRSVDSALIGDFVQAGQCIYRTHGLDYMMVRHGDRHTYNVSDYQFLVEADRICRGWKPEMAGIEEPVPPYPGLDAT